MLSASSHQSARVTPYVIRRAVAADVETIISFTLEEAREAEQKAIDVDGVRRGVGSAVEDSRLGTFWVVESDGRVVASTSMFREWSNFHGAYYAWVQSLFILPEHRGRGLVELLLDHVAAEARALGALDLRLYAYSANERALRVYRRSGFSEAPYVIMTRALQ